MKIIFSDKEVKIIKAVSLISGGFTFLVALTMLFSLIQLKILQPLDNPVLINLKEQFDKDPENQDLKEQVRAIDLMARRAYFSSRWQVETGSHLLLAGAVIFLLCQRLLSGIDKGIPEPPGEKRDYLGYRDKRRKYILLSAGVISAGAIIASFILRIVLPDPLPVMSPDTNPGNLKVTQSIVNTDLKLENVTSMDVIEDLPAINKQEEIVTKEETGQITTGPAIPKAEKSGVTRAGTNFPFFRGQGGRGVADGTGYPVEWNGKEGKNIKWKVKIPKPGFNSPVIWGSKIFLSGADEQGAEVYCISKTDGKLLWTANVNNIPGSPATNPETTEDTGLSAPSLATDGSFVCAIFASGNLICLDMEGKRLWAKALGLPKNHYGHSSSLIIYEGVLIVQYDRNDKSTLYGFNIATGEIKWETPRAVKISWASPVIANLNGRPQIILNSDPFVAAYDPVTGKEIWKIKALSAEVGPSAAVNDKMVFVGNEFAKLVGIKVGNQAEIVWEDNQFLPEVSSPVATTDLLFVATSYGAVACYNANSGELLWDHEFDYGFYASAIINGDNVYLLDVNGIMHIFKAARTFSLVADSPLGEKAVSTPAFSESRIFIRGDENLYCISGN